MPAHVNIFGYVVQKVDGAASGAVVSVLGQHVATRGVVVVVGLHMGTQLGGVEVEAVVLVGLPTLNVR